MKAYMSKPLPVPDHPHAMDRYQFAERIAKLNPDAALVELAKVLADIGGSYMHLLLDASTPVHQGARLNA